MNVSPRETRGEPGGERRTRIWTALAASETGTFDWSLATREVDFDEGLNRLFGLPPGVAVRDGESLMARIMEEDREKFRESVRRSSINGSGFVTEFRVTWPDGSIHWLTCRGAAFLDVDGGVAYVSGVCGDISPRKETERQIEERAHITALSAEIGVALTQNVPIREALQLCCEAIATHVGAAFARIWSVSEDEGTLELQASAGMYTHIDGPHARVPVGKFKIGLIAEERRPHLTNDVPNDPRVSNQEWARREGMVAFAGYPLIVGERLVGVVALFARKPLPGTVLDALKAVANSIALGVARDQNQAELLRSRSRKAAILETAMDCFVTIDSESKIVTFNAAAERTFGIPRAEAIGKPMPELIMPRDLREAHYHGMRRYLAGGPPAVMGRRLELRARRANGEEFPVELAVNRIPQDGPAMFTATLRDITERKESERQLQEARNASEAASRAKSDFLASMSHELRTPLNAIIGYGEMLQEEAAEKGASEFLPDLQKIHAAGKHLLSLINDILDLSKIEAGRMELFLETFSVPEMVESTMHAVKPQAERNGNTVRVEIEPGIGEMHSDLIRVRQCLLNLTANAAKFTEKGSIIVDVRREGPDWVVFRVQDTGVGIAEEQIAGLFRPFHQGDASISRRFGGTGLGLALTQNFCRMMGGTVGVESRLGEGATFTFRLPRVLHPEDARVARPEPPIDETSIKGTILVIDDDPTACDLIKRVVIKEGYRAVIARSGEDGLRRARELSPALITLDVMMPQMDGWSVLAELKREETTASIPVVMLTMVDDRNLGYSLGAADYLTKPVEREQLAAVLRKHACPKVECLALVIDDDEPTRLLLRSLLDKEGWLVAEAANGSEGLARMAEKVPDLILLDLVMPEMDGFDFTDAVRTHEAWRTIPVVVLTAKELTAEDRERLNGRVERVVTKSGVTREHLLSDLSRIIRTCSPR